MVARFALFVLIAVGFNNAFARWENFQGYKMLEVTPQKGSQLVALRRLENRYPLELPNHGGWGLDFFESPQRLGRPLTLLVPPTLRRPVLTFLKHKRVPFEEHGFSVAKRVREEREENWKDFFRSNLGRHRRSAASQKRHKSYLRFNKILLLLEIYKEECNRHLDGACYLKNIGFSHFGRPLRIIKVGRPPVPGSPTKHIVWIDGGIHAREWIAPAAALYFVDMLVNRALPKNITTKTKYELLLDSILDTHDFWVLSVVNPDGYEYSHTTYRYWRKNRVPNRHGYCNGVDLNRNYGFQFGQRGASSQPCADIFHGMAAFSQRENRAIMETLSPVRTRVRLFYTLHSYGQYILMPFGYRQFTYPNPIKKYYRMQCAAMRSGQAMRQVNNRAYQRGTAADLMYEASGGSDDWAHGSLGIPYSFTIELPDTGTYGFELSPAYIISVGREVVHGLARMIETIDNLESRDGDSYLERCCPGVSRSRPWYLDGTENDEVSICD